MPPEPIKPRQARLLAATKVLVSIGLLALVAAGIDFTATAGALEQLLRVKVLLAAWLVLVAQTLVLAARWWMVMRGLDAPRGFGRLARLMFVGVFFNQVLPTSFGGDAVRMWHAHRDGVRGDAAVNGVLLERVSGILGLAVMVAAGMTYLGARVDDAELRAALFASLPLVLLAIVTLALLDRMPRVWRERPLLRELAQLAAQTRRVILAPDLAVPLLLLSLLSHALAAVSIYVFALGLGLGLTVWDCLALFPAVILITLVPLSFAGWGLREGAMVAVFASVGVAPDAALAMSVVFGLTLLAASAPGLGFWLAWRSGPRPGPAV